MHSGICLHQRRLSLAPSNGRLPDPDWRQQTLPCHPRKCTCVGAAANAYGQYICFVHADPGRTLHTAAGLLRLAMASMPLRLHDALDEHLSKEQELSVQSGANHT